MKRYAIWNKTDPILTPIGEVFSPEQWIERYPIAGVESITVVCAAGEINGAFFGTLGQMVQMYEANGADFSVCETAEDKLAVIEAFEDARNAAPTTPSAEERQAQALEAIASGATAETAAAVEALEEQLAETDEVAIDLYEDSLAQAAINAEQDEAIIEIYETMEGMNNG